MSINVTVHGNPISIKKGKMVTYDDSEFERRRRIRLQQVRQQSKQIAADVRNRVRKEKVKQLSRLEKQGEKDLKQWQARKLHNLQKRYQECVNEVGTAHTNAALERNPDEVLAEMTSVNQSTAERRGKIATEKQRHEDRQRQLESTKAATRKRLIRNVEDARSTMVANIKNGSGRRPKGRKKLKTVSTDVTITNNIVTDSESGKFSSDSELGSLSESSVTDKEAEIELSDEFEQSRHKRAEPEKGGPSVGDKVLSNQAQSTALNLDGIVSNECTCVSDDAEETSRHSLLAEHGRPYYSTNRRISDRIGQRSVDSSNVELEAGGCRQQCCMDDEPRQNPVLPFVPTVSVRKDAILFDEIERDREHKVKYYDQRNHFNKESSMVPVIQKISKNSLQIHSPHEQEEMEKFRKTMAERDKKAHDRGVKAIEKVRIQKNYKKLMEELPVLQKQERLASMRTHNPTHHMSNERLQNLERERQNTIENIFEEYYLKTKQLETPVITIKPVKKTPPNEDAKVPFQVLDLTDTPPQLNLAAWKTVDKSSSEEDKEELADDFGEQLLQSKQKTLASLLERVNKQREMLLKEVSTLPASSNLHKILQDEEFLRIIRPKRPENKIFVSTASSPVPMNALNKSKDKENVQRDQTGKSPSSPNSPKANATVHKKQRKSKRYNKHEQTQTSAPQSPNKPSPVQKCPDEGAGADTKLVEDMKNNLCEIIIKMNNESNVKICATTAAKSPKKISKKSRVQEANQKCEKVVLLKTKQVEKESQTQRPRISYDVSTSTTYLSPPEIKPANKGAHTDRNAYKDVLHRKPQQSNIVPNSNRSSSSSQAPDNLHHASLASQESAKKGLNPRLVKYIKKLLSMSRQSIDELTVSSVSDVSTPGTSVLDTSTNTSLVQLQNIMNHFNLSVSDIQKYVISSDTNKQAEDTATSPAQQLQESRHSAPVQSEEKREGVGREGAVPTSNAKYTAALTKYAELTQHCSDKIAALAHLINKVRREKEQLLSSSSTDKNDNTETSYFNLPSNFINDLSKESRKLADQDKSSSSSLSSLDRYLLAIEEDLEKDSPVDNSGTKSPPKDSEGNQNYVPVLAGIPKRNERDSEELDSLKLRLLELLKESKPRPPPPTLLWNAARHNMNLETAPHELSTIIEVDTVVSSRNVSDTVVPRAASPAKTSAACRGSCSAQRDGNEDSTLPGQQRSILKKTPDLKIDISGIQPLSSDKSSSSSEDIARILQNLGLSWAVSTLKKTQESYALSSSSSADSSLKKYVSFKGSSNSSSESSFGGTSKQIDAANIHLENTTNISVYSRGSLLSRTPSQTEVESKDRRQLTSTPVLASTATSSGDKMKENLFTAESELSSVQNSEELFLSVPQASLDTNISLKKSK